MCKNTKERILLAAVSEFAENGFKATTVRNIVDRAEVKNLNSIVYYFGGKEGLYKAVLDFMFLEAEKFKEQGNEELYALMDVEDQLAYQIRFLCRAYYSVDTQLDRDLYSIFLKEAGDPTPFFNEMVERHLRPGKDAMCSLLREYFGPEVPESVIEDCEYSITAQVLYGALGWSIISRVKPDQAPFGEYMEQLTDHVVKFTLAGLKGMREPEA